MRNPYFLKSTVDYYKNLGYSKKTIECLHYLESRCEDLDEFLEEYRHLQPNRKPFHESILGIIKELHELRERLHEQYVEILQIKDQIDPAPKIDFSWDDVSQF